MTISIWRYSHLTLAASSFVFLLLICLTGIVLAFEPIQNRSLPYEIKGADTLNIGSVVEKLTQNFDEVYSIKKDKNGFIIAHVLPNDGSNGSFYINPFTAEKIGNVIQRKPIFKYFEALHRSLFLQTPGRVIIGINTFLLFLIVLTGIILIVKRQNNWKKFFAKIVKEYPLQYFHVMLGRWVLLPLLVLSLTGTYLFLERYKIIPKKNIIPKIDTEKLTETSERNLLQRPIFRNTTLSDFKSLDFPIEKIPEEYFHLKTKYKEFYINQYNGAIIHEQNYPFTTLLSELSLVLHTGSSNTIWALFLALGSLGIPYFIYSGFAMTFKRRKNHLKNVYKKDESEFIILVGSENGNTLQFVAMLQKQIIAGGKSCFVAELNHFDTFKKMKQLVVMTSTYGQGDPPNNAKRFEKLLNRKKPKAKFQYCVVGFGSLAYPHFCKFAFDVNGFLEKYTQNKPLLPVHTINNKSFESFSNWTNNWSKKVNTPIRLTRDKTALKHKKTKWFKVLQKTLSNENSDEIFLMTLKANHKKSQSGDLLAIYPKGDNTERLYTIGKCENNIVLSIKRHSKGLCSNYLHNLNVGESLQGYTVKNKKFHFPKKAKKIIFIATGTGIAPFLGMLNKPKNADIFLYWGGKNPTSFYLYKNSITKALESQTLNKFYPAYSRVENKTYIQDLIEKDSEFIAKTLIEKGIIMICGSIAMQKGVFEVLNKITLKTNQKPLSFYQNKGQIKVDCY